MQFAQWTTIKHTSVKLDHGEKKIPWESMATIKCLVTNIPKYHSKYFILRLTKEKKTLTPQVVANLYDFLLVWNDLRVSKS